MLTGANPRRRADLTLNENMRKLSVCVKSSWLRGGEYARAPGTSIGGACA